jgi:hypothetical protein
VTVTGLAVPCIASRPAAVAVKIDPVVKDGLSGTGRVSVKVAAG